MLRRMAFFVAGIFVAPMPGRSIFRHGWVYRQHWPPSVLASRMYVVKRDGSQQEVKFDAITRRLRPLCEGLDTTYVDPVPVTKKVIEGFYNGIATSEIDTLAAETCAYMSQKHPDFSILAARIAISNLHKNTSICSSKPAALMGDEVYHFVQANGKRLDEAIDYKRDLGYDYFGFKTLEKSYLLRVHGKVVERPQHLLMRCVCEIHCGDLEAALESYELKPGESYQMSQKFFTHATPTLFNAGTPTPQMSSCFLLTMKEDSIEGIYDTLKRCALISKSAGGIGVAISNVRASGSYIRGTNGYSNGLVPMLRNFNETARYAYDPNTGKGLMDLWGDDFEELYCRLEAEGKGRKTQNLGTIHCSNLCTEIIEYTSPDEVAVCNLASIALPSFVEKSTATYNFQRLYEVTKVVTKNLNKAKIAQFGLRNSLLVAPMPTASTAQILSNTDAWKKSPRFQRNESFEPYTQNLYVRRVLSGEFVQVNRHLLKDLIARNLWNEEMRTKLIAHNGSVQELDLPQELKDWLWESGHLLASMHFHGWELGLKTGLYYLRTKAAADAIKFTVDVKALKKDSEMEKTVIQSLNAQKPKYSCENCGS
eukprot:g23944.t1